MADSCTSMQGVRKMTILRRCRGRPLHCATQPVLVVRGGATGTGRVPVRLPTVPSAEERRESTRRFHWLRLPCLARFSHAACNRRSTAAVRKR